LLTPLPHGTQRVIDRARAVNRLAKTDQLVTEWW
jgi:hypothetical protein